MSHQISIVDGVKREVLWWIRQREKKLVDTLTETMSLNPFIAPFIYEYHDCGSISAMFSLLISGHLLTGHATGFGKLIDEKILPNVFNAIKLDKRMRSTHPRYQSSEYDEIDHLVDLNGNRYLLSLKAGKWTIQLTMAVQLNESFNTIINSHQHNGERIVVGVAYGHSEGLTDKYEILRGINRGANHKVHDLRGHVEVKCGREFWQWISGGDESAQLKVLQGITEALRESDIRTKFRTHIERFETTVCSSYGLDKNRYDDKVWSDLLESINK